MRVFSIIALGALAVVLFSFHPGKGGVYGYGGHYGGNDVFNYPRYQYSYGVNDKSTGDFKSAHEHREGGITKGYYSVLQPDGVLRIVNYVVDPVLGFQAQVINKGIARHAPFYGKGYRGGLVDGYYG